MSLDPTTVIHVLDALADRTDVDASNIRQADRSERGDTDQQSGRALLDHGLSLTVAAIFRPRAIFADGLLDDIERFAATPHDC